ncbi:MAG: arsenosugar biosynthesis radical SAM protein ArsS [Bdellovibrionales bacterium]|jgi:radical SAM/Cys-rich protein|nr:arsenosugar biosynthesis radical SAM protein ArsS [Bdellovibrionales bacterium]
MIAPFSDRVASLHLVRKASQILQVNIGRLCNLACHHCHVEAGPKRTENMTEATVSRVIDLLKTSKNITTVDLTGGAPELNPHFKNLVITARALGKKVIDRCNLTVLYEPGQEETMHFLKHNQVHIVASLPCYSKENVEKQRGRGVFDKSIEAILSLNALGYGQIGSGFILDLVYNPTGPFLPPAQQKLESDYKKELKELFNIEFNQLYTITNMPIKRFLKDLEKSGRLDSYMELLANSFNPTAAKGIMCRDLVSIAWNGEVFDCDFNQMLELPLSRGKTTVWDLASFDELENENITFANHCYACTAGAGSSCGGSIE